MRSVPVLALLLLFLAGCSRQAPPTTRVAEQDAAAPAPALQHVSDADEWLAYEESVSDLLLDENFAALDSLAATFGPETPVFRDGGSRERHFYLALAGEHLRVSKGERARLVGCLKRWRIARPDSRPASAGFAFAMAKLAWDERSARIAALVSDEQFARFEKDLRVAWEALAPTYGQRGNVGGWYMAALRVGLGLGMERGGILQLRNDCFRDAPWIESADGMAARAVLPRWGGARGEWEQFALSIATSSPDGRGPQRYAWILMSLQEVGDVFRESKASWPEAHAGFEALERERPDSVTLPSFHARFAWQAGDRLAAHAAFAKLGDRVDLSVWRGDAEFIRARGWANAQPS